MEHIARTVHGRIGASALVVETGESAAFHGGEHFPMESVCKLPIAMAVLNAVDRGALGLTETVRVLPADLVPPGMHSPLRDKNPSGAEISVRELIDFAIRQSDGTASDVLLRLAGGPDRVTAYVRGLGVSAMSIEETEGADGRSNQAGYRNWLTPDGAVELLKALQEGRAISPASRALLLDMMATSATSTKRIQGLLPPGTVVAHKTGTSGTFHGLTRGTNDIGLVTLPDGRHLAIAVFVADSRSDEATREAVIAKIAKAAWDRWANR